MGGALMQLVAYGAQDIYLTANPSITYFKAIYRRHTNFSTESVMQTFDGKVDFGRKVSALISRTGDLVTGAYIQIDLPDLYEKNINNEYNHSLSGLNSDNGAAYHRYTRWIDNLGHYLVKEVSLEIGGQLIDRHYSDWLEIWAQLTVPAGQIEGYRKMIGQDPRNVLGQNTGLQADVFSRSAPVTGSNSWPGQPVTNNFIKGRKLYVPLQFWFCRNEGLALPLISLQYHDVKITVEFRNVYELVIVSLGDMPYAAGAGTRLSEYQYRTSISVGQLDASLWIEYVYLDTDERRRFAQSAHEYLIEQLQFTGDEYITFPATPDVTDYYVSTVNFTHPVKELIWVVKAFEEDREWSNYTNTGLSVKYPLQTQGISTGVTYTGLTGLPTYNSYAGVNSSTLTTNNITSNTTMTELIRATQYNCTRPWGELDYGVAQNPVISCKLTLNGQDRTATMPGLYFNRRQPERHHTNIPESPGINVYSFALNPEEHDPSGTCNFSRIDKVKLHINLATIWRDGNYGIKRDGVLRVYGLSYNIFRVLSGMGGLAYTS